MKKYTKIVGVAALFSLVACQSEKTPIDREALLERNNPHVTVFDTLSSLSVGNGGFAVTVDASGLQTFPKEYSKGVPLGTQSDWGWHSFANPKNLLHSETLKDYDYHGHPAPYAVQFNEAGRQREAANWYRINPHRLHLGIVGLELPEGTGFDAFTEVSQTLDLLDGKILSSYKLNGKPVSVETVCHPERDILSSMIAATEPMAINLRYAYPTGAHSDDASNWNANDKHSTTLVSTDANKAVLKRVIDESIYYVVLQWEGDAVLTEKEKNYFVLNAGQDTLKFSCEYLGVDKYTDADEAERSLPAYAEVSSSASAYWNGFWMNGGMVDFSECTDPRAPELERRVVLSQYLMAIQAAGDTPPQETGLTYNSWFGKFHLEMIWWHQSHFPLWGHPELLNRTLNWYHRAEPVAKQIAERQGFDGIRWMKMTDPDAMEAPSKVGSFLIWQQPHLIHLAELVYRATNDEAVLRNYYDLIQKTADFMYSFATYDEANDRYILKGIIAAQETLRASENVNPPMELSSWHYGLSTAQLWRERMGEARVPEWDTLLAKLSPLAKDAEGKLYLASEDATDSYTNIRFISDHPAVTGALGMYPESRLLDKEIMNNTIDKIFEVWNWDETWGWDYPMIAMCAARVGEPDKAVDALLMKNRTNTCLVSGHNYQDKRLRLYLPGNGGLLTAMAVMCAGWDGCTEDTPGFPKDGKWNVKWEGLLPMP
ncbi:MAG: hypothetical protein IKA75_11210 [Bacteroidaceae bacterium]|nr:hypothetical protein [Bacteroidaceae bacterium]